MRTTRRQVLAAFSVLIACPARAAGQRPAPTPPPPRLPSGGFSPFRQKGFAGTSYGAAALEQPGCPLAVRVTALHHSERGVTLSMEVSNLGATTSSRQVLGAWVLVHDGTIRAYQVWVGERNIEPTRHRSVDLHIRGTVMPDDVIIMAVQETTGGGAAPWRRDPKDLEREIHEAIEQARPGRQ